MWQEQEKRTILVQKPTEVFLISNFRRVLYVVCFLLGNSPASEFYMPTFRNSVCSTFIGKYDKYAYEDGTVCSETSAYKIQTPGNYPEENIQPTEVYQCFFLSCKANASV